MELTDGMKEVDFAQYCHTCKHIGVPEELEPCFDCLAEPVNQYSHKPVKYEEKK